MKTPRVRMHQRQTVDTAVALDDFVRNAGQRAAHPVGVHDDRHQEALPNSDSEVCGAEVYDGVFMALVPAGAALKSSNIYQKVGSRQSRSAVAVGVAVSRQGSSDCLSTDARLTARTTGLGLLTEDSDWQSNDCDCRLPRTIALSIVIRNERNGRCSVKLGERCQCGRSRPGRARSAGREKRRPSAPRRAPTRAEHCLSRRDGHTPS